MSDLLTSQQFVDFVSLVIIGICFIQKIPQIIRLVKFKSVKGISIIGLFLELTSYTVMTSYNFTNGYSLLSYMEYPILLFQQYILIYFVLKYLGEINTRSLFIAIVYFIFCICLLKQVIPKTFLTFMAPLCTPISASSKIAQLLTIIRTKNADSISTVTWLISSSTNLSRVFTVWLDSADKVLLGNCIISSFLSSSITLSTIYFKTRSKKD